MLVDVGFDVLFVWMVVVCCLFDDLVVCVCGYLLCLVVGVCVDVVVECVFIE